MIRAAYALAAATLSLTILSTGCSTPVQSASQPVPTMANTPVQPSGSVISPSILAGGSGSTHHKGNVSNKAGAFDFYLLTLSWSPEYCVTHQSAAECAAHRTFVPHGLWPENSDGSYPENCSNAPGPANPGQYSDIYPDQGLLAHEWKTHGTCSGLAPDAYFQTERKAFNAVQVPQPLTGLTSTISLTPGVILADFAQANPADPSGDVVLACGNNRLTAVEVCLSKSLTAVSCGSVKTCHANVVKITPPGATSDQ